MPEDKTSISEAIARSVAKVSDSKGLEALGHGLGWGIAAIAVAAIFIVMFISTNWREAANKWDGHLTQPEKCFELRELQGKAYRVNTCTGDIQELSALAASAASPVSSAPPTLPKLGAEGPRVESRAYSALK